MATSDLNGSKDLFAASDSEARRVAAWRNRIRMFRQRKQIERFIDETNDRAEFAYEQRRWTNAAN